MLPSGKPNPFHPGYGEIPPVLAGRDRLKRNFRDRLKAANSGTPHPTAMALMGPRGCGKTALLKWVAKAARESNLPVVTMASENLSSVESIARGIARKFPKNLLERLSGVNLNVGPVGAGINLANSSRTAGAGELSSWLEALGGESGGVLLIDEAHNMPPEVGHVFYNAAQTVGGDHPLLLVIAGTPDLDSVLSRSGATFIERSRMERIGRLDREEARQALFEPFGKHIRFSDDAMEQVLDEAQNYPYFIQLWGQALWDVLARTRAHNPGMEVVNEARKNVNVQRLELYNRRMDELVNCGLLIPFAEMTWRLGEGGQPTSYDFQLSLNHIEPGVSLFEEQPESRQKLLHTGFIWQPSLGTWEYGIPSLASHVRGESVSLLLDTLKSRPESIIALAALDQCFGKPSDHLRELPRKKVTASIQEKLQASEVAPESMPGDPVAGFLAGKLLIEGDTPDRVSLAAPHLVRATVEEAIHRQLLPNPDPPARTDPEPPTTKSKPPSP